MRLQLVGKCKIAIGLENVNLQGDGKLCGYKGRQK